jgi:hypothetical protein
VTIDEVGAENGGVKGRDNVGWTSLGESWSRTFEGSDMIAFGEFEKDESRR